MKMPEEIRKEREIIEQRIQKLHNKMTMVLDRLQQERNDAIAEFQSGRDGDLARLKALQDECKHLNRLPGFGKCPDCGK